MNKTLLIIFFSFLSYYTFCQIAGPNNGSTFANIAIAGSNKSWINTGNVASSDNVYASYGSLNGSSPSYTDYLQATGFGFAIPGSVTINGIEVQVERSDVNTRTADYQIRIVKNGIISTTERSSGAGYPNADSYQTFGNSGDLWGETWTETDINAGNFGVAISARRSVSGTNAGKVDHIRIIVYYDFVILPVKLSNFSATKKNNLVELNWLAIDESNMNRYEVERSTDSRNFSSFVTVAGRNQSNSTNYTSTDINPNRGINYYRLSMIENSGRTTYSKIVSVHFSSGKTIILYPNPWIKGTELNIINANGDAIKADFYSLAGNHLGSSISGGRNVITTPLLNSKGLVFYRLTNADGYIIGKGTLQVY